MKKLLIVFFTVLTALTATAQRGIKIAYIDMEYILNKVPDYAEAKNQLEQKAQKWKQEIEVRKNEITKLKEDLKVERTLLTKELIEEREEEIAYQEKEMLDYQLKRFGPGGDLISQKSVLVKPIQDQVFTVIQDLSEARNYDFVFDKSSDLTMLFAAKRHDISDLVVRRILRAAKQEQLSSKQLKQLEEQDAQEDLEADPAYQERQQKLEDRKNERERIMEDRRAAKEAKRKEYQERRERLLREREQKRNERNGTTATPTSDTSNTTDTNDDPLPAEPKSNTDGDEPIQGENSINPKTTASPTPDEELLERQNTAAAAKAERERKVQERRDAAKARREKILADRAAAKKAREEQNNKTTETEETETTEEE